MLNLFHVDDKTKKGYVDIIYFNESNNINSMSEIFLFFECILCNMYYNFQLNCSRNFILPVIIHAETRFLELFFIDFSQT